MNNSEGAERGSSEQSLISELGLLLQNAQSSSGFCATSSITSDHQVAHYSDDVIDHVLSSFGSDSPVSASQRALEVHSAEDGVLHGLGGNKNNFAVDSEQAEQRESDEDTGKEDGQADGACRPKKRRRSAELHNLTERLRRQRLKEKMRVLQDLIPNCNKRDKASTLDDAITYIKSLQYQLQAISMGAGYTMFHSPWKMTLQPGVQGTHNPGFPQLQHGGLKAGMGYGMGMEMPGQSSVNFPVNQIGLHDQHSSMPSASSGTLQGTSEVQSFQNPGNVMDPTHFTSSSSAPVSWAPICSSSNPSYGSHKTM